MRIDKFLKVSRLIKRRTVSKEACESSKVFVNGNAAKPSKDIKEGDVVEIMFFSGSLKFKVLSVKENVKKEQADNMYEIIGENK